MLLLYIGYNSSFFGFPTVTGTKNEIILLVKKINLIALKQTVEPLLLYSHGLFIQCVRELIP
jgi:hypothetical protein